MNIAICLFVYVCVELVRISLRIGSIQGGPENRKAAAPRRVGQAQKWPLDLAP